jgi:hypothetical protein
MMRKTFVDAVFVLLFVALLPLFVAADTPSGSIVIYGYNGTVVTGSRNVHLNLSYVDGVHNISACRWANDLEANLAAAPWEPCTTVKAWILSDGYGNKTVYYQLRDTNGDTAAYNDSILYQFMQDFTAPSAPAVYDGESGDDIDWQNSNSTISAHWSGAVEDISTIYYMYRILNNSACFGDCSFTNVSTDTQVTVSSLTLNETRNFSFEVVAFNPFGLNSSVATSDGVRIDQTDPSAPVINSSTHPDQSLIYDVSSAIFNFTSVDALSGVHGYSYVLDTHPGTAPDSSEEERAWETLASLHKGSYNQTLKANSTGSAFAVFSQLHYNMTENDSIRVKVALAEQLSDHRDMMGVKVYLVKTGEGAAISSFDMESSAISNIVNSSFDVKYAESMTQATIYQFSLTVNETADDNTDDIYVVVSGLTSDDNNRNTLAIGLTKELSLIDNATKNFVCDESDNCNANTSTLDYAIGVQRQDSGAVWTARYDFLGDGVYYFHAKARDDAGNWGDTSHYKITVAAGGVTALIFYPEDGEVFVTNASEYNTTVRVGVSANASVYIVAKHADGSNFTSQAQIVNSSYDFGNITLEQGSNELYAVTNDTLGVVVHSPSVFVTVASTPQPPMSKTLRISYSGCAATPLPYLCNRDEAGTYVGIATENSGSVFAGYAQTDTSLNPLKIYLTRPFDTSMVSTQFYQNTFMDSINPMFGFAYGESKYIIRNELRYGGIHLGGSFNLPPGAYRLYLRKNGVTADGKFNITLTVE